MRNGLLILVASLACAGSPPARAADFAGGNLGGIPDGDPAGRTVTFNVSGFTQPIGSVRLRLGLSHTYVGDLTATLISPNGTARLVVFGRPGVNRSSPAFGSPSDLSGTYVFDDAGADLWTALGPVPATAPPGRYRSSTAGTGQANRGGCATSFRDVFAGLAPADVNGTWSLTLTDFTTPDPGSITSAILSVDPTDDLLLRDGFEPARNSRCSLAWLDLTGTGLTSFVLVRNTGGGANGDITWFVRSNDGTTGGAQTSFVLGKNGDFFLSGDWDGDGIDDATVWRASTGVPGRFLIRPSSRPSRLLTITHGASGDDPTLVGDYDGDGRSDATVFRAGATSGSPSFTHILPSRGGAERILATGENGSFPAGGIDYTGDGIADMAVQSNAGSGVAAFRIYHGVSGALAASFTFGAPTDPVVVGNHSGGMPADITVVRGVAGALNWTTRDASGIGQPTIVWGASASDYPLGGDYDGDGIDDHAYWRPSATAGASAFSIRPSSNPSVPINLPAGANADFPVGYSRRH